MNRRYQATGIRLQGCGSEVGVALADTKSNVEAVPANHTVSASAEAIGLEDLRPET